MENWFVTARTRSIQLSGLKTALLVGITLNLINQGSAIVSGDWTSVSFPKLLLTFCVPYCVAVYAGTQAKRTIT
jgi:hypothetical protein